METLQQLFTKAEREVNFDNRSYFCKSVNTVLKTVECKILIAPEGKVWRMKNDTFVNVKVKGYGKVFSLDAGKVITPRDVLRVVASFLQNEVVREKINANITTPHTCGKCEGKGHIPSFAHVCEGVCFDCGGIGKVGSLTVGFKPKKLTDIQFIRQYVNKGGTGGFESMPKEVKRIKAIQNINHPTATWWVGRLGDVYYIYQPVCMGNTFYTIPKGELNDFATRYKSVNQLHDCK